MLRFPPFTLCMAWQEQIILSLEPVNGTPRTASQTPLAAALWATELIFGTVFHGLFSLTQEDDVQEHSGKQQVWRRTRFFFAGSGRVAPLRFWCFLSSSSSWTTMISSSVSLPSSSSSSWMTIASSFLAILASWSTPSSSLQRSRVLGALAARMARILRTKYIGVSVNWPTSPLPIELASSLNFSIIKG